ncbi:MAG TPA: amidase [Mycobacteriales bacterium]|nr:amidase [Mycobacteriales bacterium]
MSELHDLTATEQVAALEARDVSSVELTRHYLDRIDRHDERLRCFITVVGDEALDAARLSDEARARGEASGVLHGLPIALKDLYPAAGMRTTFGSAALADLVTPADGPVVAALRRTGAVFVGKTNTPEFGPTCYTDNAVRGETQTPYGEGLSASGSSGGAAAAVAAGLIGIAHGSDGLGSLRTPAANCGLIGFKVTRGRSAGAGTGWLALAAEGALSRTVADNALFLDAMGAATDSDLWRTGPASADAFRQAAAREPGRLRVGVLEAPSADIDVATDCIAAVHRTADALRDAGHAIEAIELSDLPDWAEVRGAVKVVLATNFGVLLGTAITPEQHHLLMPYTRWLAESATHSAIEHATAESTLYAAAVRYRALLAQYDVVLSPTTTAPPQPTSALRCDDAQASLDAMGRWSAFTPMANISGTPAVSLPVHATDDGLPIGVQLSASAGSDELLMSLSAQLEQAFGWQDRHPEIWRA